MKPKPKKPSPSLPYLNPREMHILYAAGQRFLKYTPQKRILASALDKLERMATIKRREGILRKARKDYNKRIFDTKFNGIELGS